MTTSKKKKGAIAAILVGAALLLVVMWPRKVKAAPKSSGSGGSSGGLPVGPGPSGGIVEDFGTGSGPQNNDQLNPPSLLPGVPVPVDPVDALKKSPGPVRPVGPVLVGGGPDPMDPTVVPQMGKYYAVKWSDSPIRILGRAGYESGSEMQAARSVMDSHPRNAWMGPLKTGTYQGAQPSLRGFWPKWGPMIGLDVGWAFETSWQGGTSYGVVYIPTPEEL